jgi:hypothetical protein
MPAVMSVFMPAVSAMPIFAVGTCGQRDCEKGGYSQCFENGLGKNRFFSNHDVVSFHLHEKFPLRA